MKLKIILLFAALTIFACKKAHKKVGDQDSEREPTTHQLKWVLGKELLNVESVIFDAEHQVFYASCGKDYKLGNQGFIAKISAEGKLLEQKWVSGLNRPTGMAIHDGNLYVADINNLVVINTASGEILQRITEPIEKSGLNDVAISKKGLIYVTASFIHTIFKVQNAEMQSFLKDDNLLTWANGIAIKGETLTIGGTHLVSIDINSKKITKLNLEPNISDFDGIALDGEGGYYVTTVENSALWHINKNLQVEKLAENNSYFGDLDFIPEHHKIVIAQGKQDKSSFFLGVHPIAEVN
ncbi:hypothetical protein FVB32_17335 [Flagellimonas hymeniacidonis]|uniref:Uncharacterized protein n=1 Tax=Flagellimonas hymeniacidonis TaxID=2603628 RepID=A0A5C8V0D3_9FLAO|nr:SMP-30/gluconolactonase/LRE family protein [Flagellimonas hymeniacidonis]TXN34290.1 hypothetical protein FVB32_17335 [Flagellimonas hymeniacidonis]